MIGRRWTRPAFTVLALGLWLPVSESRTTDGTIALSPTSLSYAFDEGGMNPADQTVTLSNPGGGTIHWTAPSDQPWLSVSPTSGTLAPGGSTPLTVSVNARYKVESWVRPTSTIGAPSAREDHDACWTGSRMILWGGELFGTPYNTGGLYDPATDTWVAATSLTNAPSPRTLLTTTWTGTQMIVWGGNTGGTYYNEGQTYDPATDSWTGQISTIGAPSPRSFHSAVWTGSQMIIWGGFDSAQRFNTGGIYTPATNSWVATSTVNAPTPRLHHVAVWTGTEMIIWGGQDNLSDLNGGARYNPTTDTWMPMTSLNAPSPRQAATAIWSGREMIVWGGSVDLGQGRDSTTTGGRYNPASDTWVAATTTVGVPSSRQSHSAVWTGSQMIVSHGASPSGGFFNTGAVYQPPIPAIGVHTATIIVSAPDASNSPQSVAVGLNVHFPLPFTRATFNVTDMTPAPGSTLGALPGEILVTLSEHLLNLSVDTSSVRLVRAGPDGQFGTADDVPLAPSVTVVGTNHVRLNLAGIASVKDLYRVTVSGTPSVLPGQFGHWKLDEANQTFTADASGNNRNGNLQGPTWVQGRVGAAVRMEGGTERVNIDAGNLLVPWTATMWVKRENSPNGDARLTDSGTGGTSLRLEQFNPANRMGFTQYAVADYFFNYILPENAWKHVTIASTVSGTKLYVDGTNKGTNTAFIDLSVDKLGTHDVNALKGALDDVQIYSRELTPDEIRSLAALAGSVRSSIGDVLDGEFVGMFPSGNGLTGGDFTATFRVGP